jgi:hypothetical protein
VELRRWGSDGRVGGRRHGHEHAVHRVVRHVVHLGVDLVAVVAGPKTNPGVNVMILKSIFAKKLTFFIKLMLFFPKIDHNIGFWEKRQIFRPKFSENRRKLWSKHRPLIVGKCYNNYFQRFSSIFCITLAFFSKTYTYVIILSAKISSCISFESKSLFSFILGNFYNNNTHKRCTEKCLKIPKFFDI